jgi:predicted ATPase
MNGIGFKNMKVFREKQWFDFKNITLLTGTNNSGKSSVINAMQMLQDNLPKYTSKIDDIISTQFRLKTNQNKHGNIESFVNRNVKNKNNAFAFSINENNLLYNVLVEINEGIESYGTVKAFTASDPLTNETIFELEVNNKLPNLVCTYRINYKYFVNRLKNKCKNTIGLHKDIVQLDKLLNRVNVGIEPVKSLYKKADEVGNKYSVYVIVHIVDNEPNHKLYGYMIWDEPLNGVNYSQSFFELGVLFNRDKNANNNLNFRGLVSKKEFKARYLNFYERGVFDFNQLYGGDNEVKLEFEQLISDYYNANLKESYNKLNDNILTILSNTYWKVEEMYSEEDSLLTPANLVEKYISCHPDFGLIGSTLVRTRNNDEYGRKDFQSSFIANNYLIANKNLNIKNKEIQSLINNGFFETIHPKLQHIIFENYNHKNEGKNFKNREKILVEAARDFIFNEIELKIIKTNLKIENTYVSSNRFQTKRSYNFSDNSDFTSFLKTIEMMDEKTKNISLSFINKWIKEFDIADELVLKADVDTGNFKAYLKLNGQDILLADYGLGTNQLLPILFALSIHFYGMNSKTLDEEISKRTVVIEEPEANLHPAMQSKLADLFIDANKTFGVQIIAETHSEYLIRKLQYLIGSNKYEVKPEDVIIYYFYKPDHEAVVKKQASQVEKIEIDNFGRLTKEFGSGFFDEADKIALDIFLLMQGQSN